MNIKLLFIPLLLFSSELYAETIHLGILNTSGNEAENVLLHARRRVRVPVWHHRSASTPRRAKQ